MPHPVFDGDWFEVRIVLRGHSVAAAYPTKEGKCPRLRLNVSDDYLNRSECEPVLNSDNTKTSSIFSYINKKSGSI